MVLNLCDLLVQFEADGAAACVVGWSFNTSAKSKCSISTSLELSLSLSLVSFKISIKPQLQRGQT